MNKTIRMTFASSLSDICSKNASFDSGVLKICYPGRNRNGSYFEKEDLIRCLPSLYNCPVVCNYDRDTDTIGGHDVELVSKDGGYRLVNKTAPVGVIPESAKYWFAECEEEDGTKHEYLFTEALIWKRQEAYEKIKRDGVTAQSMEITIKDGENVDGVYHIRDFEFTALTLIGVEPCFEGASLTMETFSTEEKEAFKRELSEMMQDLKETYSTVTAPGDESGDDNIPTHNITTEGGDRNLDEKMKLLEEFGRKHEDLDFSIDDLTVEELREKLAKFEDEPDNDPEDPEADPEDPEVDPEEPDADPDGADDDKDDDADDSEEEGDDAPAAEDDGDDDTAPLTQPGRIGGQAYELTSNIGSWLRDAVCALGSFTDEWGYECPNYWMLDYDTDAGMVYCEDERDWKIYGFSYTMSGDKPVIDVGSKKRMKREYAEFIGEDAPAAVPAVYSVLADAMREKSDEIARMDAEIEELKKFKKEIEDAEAESAREAIYANFADLAGNEAFEALKEHAGEYTVEALEEKCYALRGRAMSQAKFSFEQKAPKLVVDKTHDEDKRPYGGLVERYGGNAR